MTCSRNLFNHFFKCYQIKTNREMFQHDFQIFTNLMDFFSKKNMNPFSYLIFTFVQNSKPKKNLGCGMCIWMFSIIWSHFERIKWNLPYEGCHNHFWKKYFIFRFVDYGLVTTTWGWVHIWGGGKENKMSKDECDFFTTKLG
jgi:hypothetical protein